MSLSTQVAPSEPGVQTCSAVRELFTQSSYAQLKRIHCDFEKGVLVLKGELPTYFLKQIAQSLATHAPGVRTISNRILVVDPDLAGIVRSSS